MAAPYLRKGRPVPQANDCSTLRKFAKFWRCMFVAKDPTTNSYRPIGPAEQAIIDSLGLTHIVSGMRDGTLPRYNPAGLPKQLIGKKRSGTKCTVCGVVSNSGSYPKHLHVDVSGVEGADESDAPPIPPLCFRALVSAAPYLRKGWPVPEKYLSMATNFWQGKFYTEGSYTNRFAPLSPDQQAAIDRLGLTHIVGGMREGKLPRFTPKGLSSSFVFGEIKCTVCGEVLSDLAYTFHLHTDVTGVEGADASCALVPVDSSPEPEVCVFWCCGDCRVT
jgi:hypothetical protein